MFACFLSTPSYILLAVVCLGGFFIVGPLAQFSFSNWAICFSLLFAWAGSAGGACLFPGIHFGWCGKKAEERQSEVLRFAFILSLALTDIPWHHKRCSINTCWMNGCGELVAERRARYGDLVDGKARSVTQGFYCSPCCFSDRLMLDCSGSCNHEAGLPGPQTKLTGVFISLSCRQIHQLFEKAVPEDDWQTKQIQRLSIYILFF